MVALKEYVNDELGSSIIDTLYLDIEKLSYVNDTVSRTLGNE